MKRKRVSETCITVLFMTGVVITAVVLFTICMTLNLTMPRW